MKKMDIRTKFTQKALKDSLIELMKTTPIRDIPIKVICIIIAFYLVKRYNSVILKLFV
jgi:hypothetical protein